MDWVWFLFSFKGRINRAKLWLSLLVVLCWILFTVTLVAGAGKLLGGPRAFYFNLNGLFAVLDPDTYHGLTRSDIMPAAIHVVLTPLFTWVFAAGVVKRLHDRDRSAWWLVPFFVAPGLVNQFADRMPGTILPMIIGGPAALLSLWGFIDLYCMAGDRWTNRFGPNPLPKSQTRTRAGYSSTGGGSGWDQHGALE
jgi:uncharacterized membrane protein YhaH (DUF805 family)